MEKFYYSCGGPVIEYGHQLENIIFVRLNIVFNTKISAQYYNMGTKIDGFKMICFNCLEECQPAIESGNITKQYQAFFPRCNECKALGTSSFIRKKPQNNKQGTKVN